MGYIIKIGEAKKIDNTTIYDVVEEIHNTAIPTNDGPIDHINIRCPSYTGWNGFIEECGLQSIFDGPRSLMPHCPGNKKISRFHVDFINSIDVTTIPKSQLGRFSWLKYWLNWAWQNCKNPICVNY